MSNTVQRHIPPNDAFAKAVKIIGRQQFVMGMLLGVSQQSISYWTRRGYVPPEYVLAIEKVTKGKVTRHDLRPDLYPPEEKKDESKS